jgi:hypothetical protein
MHCIVLYCTVLVYISCSQPLTRRLQCTVLYTILSYPFSLVYHHVSLSKKHSVSLPADVVHGVQQSTVPLTFGTVKVVNGVDVKKKAEDTAPTTTTTATASKKNKKRRILAIESDDEVSITASQTTVTDYTQQSCKSGRKAELKTQCRKCHKWYAHMKSHMLTHK